MTAPRGFTDWRPSAKLRPLLESVLSVIEEYRNLLPLTLRQIYYRLVGTGVIDKTEKAYHNLLYLTALARRARIIPMDVIRDDGFTGGLSSGWGYDDVQEWLSGIKPDPESFSLDSQLDQDERLAIWCEAAGMVPQIERVSFPYGVPVKSSGGFDSITSKHAIAAAFKNVHILHIGDYDPSGECMFTALAEDIQAFADHYGNTIRFTRLAVTEAQIALYDLPTAPPKHSTHQASLNMRTTTQAEALDPATLAEIVRLAIEDHLDMTTFHLVQKRTAETRRLLEQELALIDFSYIEQLAAAL